MDVSFWLIAYLILAALAIVQCLLLGLQTWENRRYARSCMRRLERHRPVGRAAVFAPCKGIDTDLEENLRALFHQDYHNYDITFIVESREDAACAVIRRLMAEHHAVAARLVVAGRATQSGQKVHNLRVATAELTPEIEYLAFVDSDAQPRPEWLRTLIARLDRPGIGATTGYRWFIPTHPTLANLLLYSINCGVAVLLGRRSHQLVWGGSWAIRRDLFHTLGVRAAWKGTLSDDLVVSRLLGEAGLPTRFEPAAMIASPLDMSGRQMFTFLRRQYLVARYYVPRWWALGLANSTGVNLAWLGSLGALASSLVVGSPPLWIALGILVTLYLVGAYRGAIRQSLLRTYFPDQLAVLRRARSCDIWAGPLVGLVNWLGMLSSMMGRHICWRGIKYRVYRGGQIRLVERDGAAKEPAIDDCPFFQPSGACLGEIAHDDKAYRKAG